MRIVRLGQDSFEGFNGDYYVVRRPDGNVDLVRECKVLSPDGNKVAFCKPDGTIEPSYATVRKHGASLSFMTNF